MQIVVEAKNDSQFQIEFIQIDENGENVKVKLTNGQEHRVIVSWYGKHYMQTTWMSEARKKALGIEDEEVVAIVAAKPQGLE